MHEWITEWYLVVTAETSQGEEIVGLDTRVILPIVTAVAVAALGIFAIRWAVILIKRALKASGGNYVPAPDDYDSFDEYMDAVFDDAPELPEDPDALCPHCGEPFGDSGAYPVICDDYEICCRDCIPDLEDWEDWRSVGWTGKM